LFYKATNKNCGKKEFKNKHLMMYYLVTTSISTIPQKVINTILKIIVPVKKLMIDL